MIVWFDCYAAWYQCLSAATLRQRKCLRFSCLLFLVCHDGHGLRSLSYCFDKEQLVSVFVWSLSAVGPPVWLLGVWLKPSNRHHLNDMLLMSTGHTVYVHKKVREEKDGVRLYFTTDRFNAFTTFPVEEYISRVSGWSELKWNMSLCLARLWYL